MFFFVFFTAYSYLLIAGELFHLVDGTPAQKVPLAEEAELAWRELHEKNGHPGRDVMRKLFAARFFWPGIVFFSVPFTISLHSNTTIHFCILGLTSWLDARVQECEVCDRKRGRSELFFCFNKSFF